MTSAYYTLSYVILVVCNIISSQSQVLDSFPSTIFTCPNATIHLSWGYQSSVPLEQIVWTVIYSGDDKTTQLMSKDSDKDPVVTSEKHVGRITFLPSAGLELSRVTPEEAGTYSVSISFQGQAKLNGSTSLTFYDVDGCPNISNIDIIYKVDDFIIKPSVNYLTTRDTLTIVANVPSSVPTMVTSMYWLQPGSLRRNSIGRTCYSGGPCSNQWNLAANAPIVKLFHSVTVGVAMHYREMTPIKQEAEFFILGGDGTAFIPDRPTRTTVSQSFDLGKVSRASHGFAQLSVILYFLVLSSMA